MVTIVGAALAAHFAAKAAPTILPNCPSYFMKEPTINCPVLLSLSRIIFVSSWCYYFRINARLLLFIQLFSKKFGFTAIIRCNADQ